MKLKTLPAAVAATLLMTAITPAQAITLDVQITNLTAGFFFTPRLLVAHDLGAPNTPLFTAGTPASDGLVAIAEGGSTAALTATLNAGTGQVNRTFGPNPNGVPPLVFPATSSAVYSFDSLDFSHLSLLSMMIPTNDAFIGLNNWEIPTEPGTYTININAYDAGSEDNDEINSFTANGSGNPDNALLTVSDGGLFGGASGRPGMATPPPTQPLLGSGALGVAVATANGTLTVVDDTNPNGGEGNVHIHRNTLGDADIAAGLSDLDATVHRWLNPVARLTVTVPAQ